MLAVLQVALALAPGAPNLRTAVHPAAHAARVTAPMAALGRREALGAAVAFGASNSVLGLFPTAAFAEAGEDTRVSAS